LNWWFQKYNERKLTIDIDSTVIERYGKQEGVGSNYKSHHSHHPIIAFAAEIKMVVHSTMREGNAVSNTGFDPFLDELLKILSKEKIGLIRSDSGFYGNPTLKKLESEDLKYIVAAKMNGGLVERILTISKWRKLKNGIEYSSFEYKAQGWKEYRHFVVVRKDGDKLPQSTGKTLFPDHDQYLKYRYSAYVTNADLSDELIWEVYKHRAEAENQIKELKYDYGMDGFAFKQFDATEFAFRWITIAYNLMSAFRTQVVSSAVTPTLSTLKYNCIAIGAYLKKRSRKRILVLAVAKSKQEYISSLFRNLVQILEDPEYSIA
jgi:hypothetical protein